MLISVTDPEERVFTVYLGDIPADVELATINLNGVEFAVPFPNTSSYTITEDDRPNNTHCYILRVPLDDPVVIQQVKCLHIVLCSPQMAGCRIHSQTLYILFCSSLKKMQ